LKPPILDERYKPGRETQQNRVLQFVKRVHLRGFPGFLKGDVFRIGHGNALGFQQ